MVSKALFSSESTEWETPDDLFEALNEEFHFTLDVCASSKNRKLPRYFAEKEDGQCSAVDGLVQDWSKDVCFMNPPYGKTIGRWIEKAYRESLKGAVVVCLLPSRTDTRWIHDYVLPFARNVNLPNVDVIWASGIIDGEGCIFVRKNEPTPSSKQVSVIHNVGISVRMTHEGTVRRLRSIFGVGHITTQKVSPGCKPVWSWCARSNEARKVLEKTLPWLVTKQAEAYEALKFFRLKKGRAGHSPISPELLEKRITLYEKLREMKKTSQPFVNVEVRFIRGRLKFGGAKNSAPFPSMICVFGEVRRRRPEGHDSLSSAITELKLSFSQQILSVRAHGKELEC